MVWPNAQGNSVADPFLFNEYSTFPDNNTVVGLTEVSKVLAAGQTVNAEFSIGNSIVAESITESGSPLYTPTNTLIQMMQLATAALYTGKEPSITIGSNPVSSVWMTYADYRRGALKCDRWIGLLGAVNGTLLKEWAPGGRFHSRALAGSRRFRAHGLPSHRIHCHFGENERYLADFLADTSYADSFEADYKALIDAWRADGFAGEIVLSIGTWINGGLGAHSAALQAAVDNVIAARVNTKRGANIDDLGLTYRHDTTHLNYTFGRPAYALRLHSAVG